MKQQQQQLDDIRNLIQGRACNLTTQRGEAAHRAHQLALEALVMANDASIDTHGEKRVSRRIAALEKKALLAHGETIGLTSALASLRFILEHGIINHAYESRTPRLSRATRVSNVIDRPTNS